MFPPTCAAIPLDCRMWPVSAVVVVFPFDAGDADDLALQKPARQFEIADHAHAAAPRALRAPSRSAGTPGESTISSASANDASVCGSTVDRPSIVAGF